jgi:type IV pilus assembly protein PilV
MRSAATDDSGRPLAQVARGFSLVELLVALAVGAIALLGAAVVAVEGLRAGGAALRTAVATNLVADMAARIRANVRATPAYAGVGPGHDARCSLPATSCTPADLAGDDWFQWLAAIEARLPQGAAGSVLLNQGDANGAPCPCTIEVSWPEPGQAHTASVRLVLP